MPYRAEDYEAEMGDIQNAIDESSGYQRLALEQQMKSADAARKNAMEIAQLQAKTSRYGIDAQTKIALEDRLEKAREFDAEHGLDIAKAYTAFSSTPDMMFARNDFMSALGNVGQAGGMPQPYGNPGQGQPHAKTWQDFAAISQYNGSQIPGAAGGGGGGGTASAQSSSGGGGTSAPPDPRLKAANAVMQAIPPSQTGGADENDFAALSAIRSLYETSMPGSIERLGPEREKIALAGMARLGYDPRAVALEYKRSRPGQASPLLA